MNRSKFIFQSTTLLFLFLFGLTVSFAQAAASKTKGDPTYEIFLQVLVGSNEPGAKADLPSNLSNISRQLKANFSFSNYRLATTFIGRVGNEGSLEYKSVANIFGEESDAESLTFLEYTIGNFRELPDPVGEAAFHLGSFRFGAKIPVRVGGFKDESGKAPASMVNWEHVGITGTRITVPENTPTLMGTLMLPKTKGTVFLILTARAAGPQAR